MRDATTPCALITGANRGLGKATAARLLKAGWGVWLTARQGDDARAAAAELAAQGLTGATPHPLDVTDPASRAALVDELRRRRVALAALIHNAGVSLQGFDAGVVARTLAVNVYGPLRLTEALLPLLSDGARVVMVSSGMGQLGAFPAALRREFSDPDLDRDRLLALLQEFSDAVARGELQSRGWPANAYRVSKAGLNALARVLAREHPRLRINAVSPGWVRTRMGGPGAPRSPDEAAEGVTWAATLPADGPSGGFFQDGRPLPL